VDSVTITKSMASKATTRYVGRNLMERLGIKAVGTIAGSILCTLLFMPTEGRPQGATQSGPQELEFIFYGDKVRGIGHPHAWVQVGEKISMAELNERFSAYQLTLTDKCGGFCVVVKGNAGSIIVHYDAEANEVTGIVGDRSAIDDYGNKVGVSLLDANRTVNLRCESDEHVTCMSAIIEGLGYITGGDENCKFSIIPGVTSVPPCATIEGFEILAKNQPHSQ
jgi:hypothetical protein